MSAPASSPEAFAASCLRRQAASCRLADHQVDLLPAGPVLVVSFEPAAVAKVEPDLDRPAWGQPFVQRRGHTLLGVKRLRTDWYRSADLHHLFRLLQANGFFQSFDDVVFYGASMGGYAALSFAAAAPGCTVLAMNPQSTLAPERVWFDQRFAGARAAAWQGDFVDGVDGAQAARRVYVCFDPWQAKDRLHAQRLPAHNRVNLRLPFVGHKTTLALQQLRLMGRVFDGALAGSLSEREFRGLARARVQLAVYHAHLAERGVHLPRRLRCLARAQELDPADADVKRLEALLRPPREGATPRPPARRWPPGIVVAPRLPLLYLRVPGPADALVQNLLFFMAHGRYPDDPGAVEGDEGLVRSRNDDEATHDLIDRHVDAQATAFTFVSDPARRAHACFTERIAQHGPGAFAGVRAELEQHWGLRLAAAGEPVTLDRHRENFACFLHFVEANLAGRSNVRLAPQWMPQGAVLAPLRARLKSVVIGHVETFRADMAQLIHRARARKIPDMNHTPWRPAPPDFSFEQAATPGILAHIRSLYATDYAQFGYEPPAACN